MSRDHLNYIILHDGMKYYLFERLGKKVPFDAYNKEKAIFVADTVDEILAFSRIEKPENLGIDFPENQGSPKSKSWGSPAPRIDFSENRKPRCYEIEHKPYEVMFNE